MLLKPLFVSLIILVSGTTNADQISWYVLDHKPYQYYEDGEFKGYGIKWMQLLQAKLPEYQHNTIQANHPRLFRAIESGKKVCGIGFYKTKERDKIVYYSIPDILWLPLQMFMRKQTFDQLGKPKSVSVENILIKKLGIMGITTDSSYNTAIDKILPKYQESNQVFNNYYSTVSEKLFTLLAAKRIDFVMGYPSEGAYIIKQIKAVEQLTSVPIKEALDLSFTHTICSKNSWGKEVVSKINKALIVLRKTDQWRENYEQTIDPNLIDFYRQQYRKMLLPIVK